MNTEPVDSAAGRSSGIPEPTEVRRPSAPAAEARVSTRSRWPRSLILVVLAMTLVVVVLLSRRHANGTDLRDLHPGTCIVAPGERFTRVRVVDCEKPHTGEVFATGT